MNLLFFGADNTWETIQKTGFKRRNVWILKTFGESHCFQNVFAVHLTSRKNLFISIFKKKNPGKIKDVLIANFIPIHIKNTFLRSLNFYLIRFQFYIQGANDYNDKNNIIWTYWPSGFHIAEMFKLNGRYFFDTDHNIIDDINIEMKEKRKQKEVLLRAGKKCEKVISSSRSMLAWYANNGFDNLYRLRNGICLDRFYNEKQNKPIRKQIIGYVGTLSRWIDYNLFEKIIRKNPNCEFHIYGKNYKTQNSSVLDKYKNVYLLGEISPTDFPKIVNTFSIALNVYKKSAWMDVDSMKIFEYLAAGIPVVTTNFHDFLKQDFENLLYIGNSFAKIQNHIKNILNNKTETKNPVGFLNNNTWKKQITKLITEVINA